MQKKNNLISLVVVLVSLLVAGIANSQEFKESYDDWSVYTVQQDGQKLCYTVSFPTDKKGNYSKRGEPYVMVTNVGGGKDEFSVTSGYKYKKDVSPQVIIGKNEYDLGTVEGEFAWFKTSEYDGIIVVKMKNGKGMTIKGTSAKGSYSGDSYSLKGFSAAYTEMHRLCKE